MAHGSLGRGLMSPLLIVNLVVYLIIVGLASWSLNKYIDGQQTHHHLGGNSATTYMLIYSLLAGVLGTASILIGFSHTRSWSIHSMSSASSSATIAWAVMALAFGFVWKEIRIGGYRGKRLQTLEVFVIVATATQLLYLVLLHAGSCSSRYGPGSGASAADKNTAPTPPSGA